MSNVTVRWILLLVEVLVLCVLFSTAGAVEVFEACPGDANPIGGNWTTGIKGTTTGCQCSGGVLIKQGPAAGDGCYITNSFLTRDQELYALLPNATNHATTSTLKLAICVQQEGTATWDGYALEFAKIDAADDTLTIQRWDNGVATALGVYTREIVNNDEVALRYYDGGNMELHFRSGGSWSFVLGRKDTTYTCANRKIGILNLSSTHQVDNFIGRDIPPLRRRLQRMIHFR